MAIAAKVSDHTDKGDGLKDARVLVARSDSICPRFLPVPARSGWLHLGEWLAAPAAIAIGRLDAEHPDLIGSRKRVSRSGLSVQNSARAGDEQDDAAKRRITEVRIAGRDFEANDAAVIEAEIGHL